MDTSKWTGDDIKLVHMGAPPDYSREGAEESHQDRLVRGEWSKPNEDIEHEGCPGSYIYSPFIRSLLRYRRSRDEHGGRVSNPFLDRCQDDFVLSCIMAMEYHEDEARGEWLTKVQQQREKKD